MDHLQRAVGQAIKTIKLGKPEMRRQVIRFELADPCEQLQRLTEEPVSYPDEGVRKAKTGFVEWPAGIQHRTPGIVPAELIERGFGQVQRHLVTGLKAVVELEIDPRDAIVGIEFMGHFKMFGGDGQVA